jgi:hypothetical protein
MVKWLKTIAALLYTEDLTAISKGNMWQKTLRKLKGTYKPYSIHTFICFHQLNKFLNSQIELHCGLELTQLWAIIIAPFKALGSLMLCKWLLNLTGDQEHICNRSHTHCKCLWLLLQGDAQGDPYTASTTALWQLPADTPTSKAGETWWEMATEFCILTISFIPIVFFSIP